MNIAVIHNHLWVIDVLAACGLAADDDCIVEVEERSSLVELVDRPAKDVRVLVRGEDFATALVSSPRTPAPLMLAPISPMGESARLSSYSLAFHGLEGFDRTVLLVPVSAVTTHAHLLRLADRVRVLWDVAEPVGRSLDDLTQHLLDEALFEPESWDGVQLYQHPARSAHPERLHSLQRVFANHPDLVRPTLTLDSP